MGYQYFSSPGVDTRYKAPHSYSASWRDGEREGGREGGRGESGREVRRAGGRGREGEREGGQNFM